MKDQYGYGVVGAASMQTKAASFASAASGLMDTSGAMRTPEILRMRDDMEKALTNCAVLVDAMEARLSAIARPYGPQPETSGNLSAGTATPLGESMQSQVFAAERIGARLRDLLDRLEL